MQQADRDERFYTPNLDNNIPENADGSRNQRYLASLKNDLPEEEYYCLDLMNENSMTSTASNPHGFYFLRKTMDKMSRKEIDESLAEVTKRLDDLSSFDMIEDDLEDPFADFDYSRDDVPQNSYPKNGPK